MKCYLDTDVVSKIVGTADSSELVGFGASQGLEVVTSDLVPEELLATRTRFATDDRRLRTNVAIRTDAWWRVVDAQTLIHYIRNVTLSNLQASATSASWVALPPRQH